mmetsp:Transcript_23590/g.57835  ORF Transcript_23590/g.57835 Transcript_23590/m.57835 type:complete len:201 (+) Transcript_23590:213-815(+)
MSAFHYNPYLNLNLNVNLTANNLSTAHLPPGISNALGTTAIAIATNQRNSSSANKQSKKGKAVVASPTDIICGRGFHIVNHRGNLNFHLIVNEHRKNYLKSRRPEKTKIIKHVLDEIKKSGARFIRSVSTSSNVDTWEEVDDETAYKKVSHALRLRTKNETNKAVIAEADAFHRRAEQRGGNATGSTVSTSKSSSKIHQV